MKKLFTLIGTVLLSVGVNAQTTLKVESFRMGIGEQKTITLDLNNSDFADAAAFCCDIVLPDGVEIAANEEGTYLFSVSDKDSRSTSSDLVIASAKQSDGAVRVVCFPKDAKAFASTSGAVLNIPLVASKELTKGTEVVTITNQEITNTNGLSTIKPNASIADLINSSESVNFGPSPLLNMLNSAVSLASISSFRIGVLIYTVFSPYGSPQSTV
jgi:hypothetical protein